MLRIKRNCHQLIQMPFIDRKALLLLLLLLFKPLMDRLRPIISQEMLTNANKCQTWQTCENSQILRASFFVSGAQYFVHSGLATPIHHHSNPCLFCARDASPFTDFCFVRFVRYLFHLFALLCYCFKSFNSY